MKTLLAALIVIGTALTTPTFGQKALYHYISLPLIEGTGIYSAAMALSKSETPATQAAAITNIGLLATNASLGITSAFLPSEKRERLTKVHRALGFIVTAAGVWLSVSMSVDENTKDLPARYVSYGYTGMTTVPLIMFAF